MEISLRPATLEDAVHLFQWRNDPETRRSSINTDSVGWEDHIKWLNESLTNPHRKLFIAYNQFAPVGTIRIDDFGGSAELSWTVAPQYRGHGYAKAMIQAAIRAEPDKDIFAVIKMTNGASVKVASACGFVFDKQQGDCGIWKINKRRGFLPGNS